MDRDQTTPERKSGAPKSAASKTPLPAIPRTGPSAANYTPLGSDHQPCPHCRTGEVRWHDDGAVSCGVRWHDDGAVSCGACDTPVGPHDYRVARRAGSGAA